MIGEILVKAFSDLYNVFIVDVKEFSGTKYFKSDISDYLAIESILKEISPVDCVVHLGGDSDTNALWDSVLKNNIIGTRNIYECCKNLSIPKVVFASSNHVTGAYEGNPKSLHLEETPKEITVDDPIRPDSDYGVSKIFGEIVARKYFELYNVKSICLRIGHVILNDDPTKDPRDMKIWLSHRDLVDLVKKSIETDIDFGVYYGVSGNKGKFWDIANAEHKLGYIPQDDASIK